MDTIRWTPDNTRPPITNDPSRMGSKPEIQGGNYHIAYLLPFLTKQAVAGSVPGKSTLALQFYTGAKIALQQFSEEGNMEIQVDVWDTQANDADFEALLKNNSRLLNSYVFIGPIRSSHLEMISEWAKTNRKIVVSPDSPSSGLAKQNPDFIQLNPSLESHCAGILKYIKKTSRADAVTIICKEKEAGRIAYFQKANGDVEGGTSQLRRLIMPDAATNFERVDLKQYIRPGRTSVFILPTWTSQDYVMALLRRLKAVKGSNKVEVYGMPQWQNFDVIDAEYLREMNVHISAASYLDYTNEEIKSFQQKFYEMSGTIPNEDAFNGYDATMFTLKMLGKYGLSFPENLDIETFKSFHGIFTFSKIFNTQSVDDSFNKPDYLENTRVHILKYGQYGYQPVDR